MEVQRKWQLILDQDTEAWGIKVTKVEVKQGTPGAVQRAMARQAEAERERRAKVIHADGEFSSTKLADADKSRDQKCRHPVRYCPACDEKSVERTQRGVSAAYRYY